MLVCSSIDELTKIRFKECEQTSCYGCNKFMVRLMVNSTVYTCVKDGETYLALTMT